jgi:hypothetical protein
MADQDNVQSPVVPPESTGTRLDKFLNNVVNKFHMILGGLCQGSVMLYHYKTGKDLGPVVSTTVFAFYGFLLGHAGVYQFKPDQDNH